MTREFAGTLSERIAVERQIEARTAMGLAAGEWESTFEGLASVVPEGAGAETEGQALSAMPRYRVTLRTRAGLSVGQRVVWRGRRLTIRQLIDDPRRPDRIVLRCEEAR